MRYATPIAALLGAFVLMFSTAASAAVPVLQGTTLTGATGVLVDGKSYTVEFKDGTCASLFGGCNQASDFTFQTQASALLAGHALLDQVLLNGPSGNFDTQPWLTNGCQGQPGACLIFIPYSIDQNNPNTWYMVTTTNTTSLTDNSVIAGVGIGNENTTNIEIKTFAVFTPTDGSGESPGGGGAVPEPSTWAMMILGFGLVSAAMRRARRRSFLERATLA